MGFLYSSKALSIEIAEWGTLVINIEVGDKISYSLQHKGKSVIVSSPISMLLDCDKTLGEKSKVKMYTVRKINETISTAFYKRNQIDNFCNELVITFKEDFQLNFRAYNEGWHIVLLLRRTDLLL